MTVVWVTTQFEGFHRWEHAPDDVGFLRSRHRHMFHVKLGVKVNHNDRDVEFFQLKKELDSFIQEILMDGKDVGSCEMIAERLQSVFKAAFCEVSEDGENGAIVYE